MGREREWNEDDEDVAPAPFDKSKLAIPEDVKAFTGENGHCCTIENFRVDLEGTPRSLWNASAAMVFAKAFVKLPDAPSRDVKLVAKAFSSHFVGLRLAYLKWKNAGTAQLIEQQKAHRRRQRKAYVSTGILLSSAN